MTLYYPFPVIETIEDVLPHIDDHFRVIEKEGWTFINYNQMGPDVFPAIYHRDAINVHPHSAPHRAAVRRECRGITFDSATGRIVSRPFHKFFNAGEREDVSLDKIDLSLPHQIVEKLDGSMIRPLDTGMGFRWGTKMGVTDVGMLAEEFVASKIADGSTGYLDVAHYCRSEGLTPLFEFCSRRSRIVVDFPEDVMVLLAIRDNVTGKYMPRNLLRALAGSFDCPVVDYVDYSGRTVSEFEAGVSAVADMDAVVESVREDEGGEGKIVVFHDGHAVKIKSDWYVRVHRAKDMMRSEMRLLDLVFNEELDDLMATLMPEDRARIEAYLESYHEALGDLRDRIDVTYRHVRSSYETKKDFATSHYGREVISPAMKSLVFGLWDGKIGCPTDAALKVIRNAMTSETKFAEMKTAMKLETGWDDVWANDMEDAA